MNVAPSASAASPLTCAAGTIYNLSNTGGLYALNTSTSVDTPATPSTIGAGETFPNALGISTDGTIAYSADENVTASGTTGTTTVDVENVSTGTNTSYTARTAGGAAHIIAGAVDPANGYFYYGGWNAANTEFTLLAFNPSTDTASEAGTITPSGSGTYGNGDIAFDGTGDLYLLGGSGTSTGAIIEVDAAAIATSGNSALANTTLATLTGTSGTFDGIAFAADSELYAENNTGGLFEINPDSGAVTTLATQTGFTSGGPVDLASCSYNATLEVESDVVGRAASSDQFTLTITGGGITAGNTGTTTGTSTGLQTSPGEIAGPVVGLPNTTYTVSESAAPGSNTNLSTYGTTYACLNGTTSLQKGSGAGFTLDFPAASGNTGAQVVCTFTNTPLTVASTTTSSPTTTSTSTTTTTAPTTTPTTAAPGGSLAFTGIGSGPWWALAAGGVLCTIGMVGRRRASRRPARDDTD